MARKIFWGLWMTVWPAVVLIPPLLTAQSPRRGPERGEERSAVALIRESATDFGDAKNGLVLEPPVLDVQPEAPVRDPFEPTLGPKRPLPKPKTTHRVSQPRFEPAENERDAGTVEESEPQPDVSTVKDPVTSPRTANKPVQRGGLQLNAQEERAQKLIHERAMLRAKQRQDRLAAKHWGQHAPRVTRRTTSWRPQVTQPNALADFDRIETPRDADAFITTRGQ